MIEVQDVRKHFGTVEALRGVTFTVPRGHVVGLLGPNGAGKTTAMRILTGYIAPTSGTATVDGQDVFEDPVVAQRKIGYLPEGNPLYLDLRLRESLRFAAEMQGLRGSARDGAVEESMRLAGIADHGHRVLGTLSKGYRQRAGLAQALLHRPPILILDEPTSGLDPNQQEDMRELVRTLGKERTVILSTHILPEVEAVCDRVLIISRGQVVADGTVEEIKVRAAGGAVAIARVRGDALAAETAFRTLDFAKDVAAVPVDEASGLVDVRIGMDGTATPERMERVAAVAHARSLPLSALAAQTATLERVFAELTDLDAGAGGAAAPAAVEAVR
jgi:ABC-2 type transport system ATP-binding protein